MKIFKNQKFLHIIYTYTNLQFYHRVNRIIFFVVSLSFLIDISPYWKTLLTFEENKFFLEAEQKLHNIFFLTFASATYYRNYSSITNNESNHLWKKYFYDPIVHSHIDSFVFDQFERNFRFLFFFWMQESREIFNYIYIYINRGRLFLAPPRWI